MPDITRLDVIARGLAALADLHLGLLFLGLMAVLVIGGEAGYRLGRRTLARRREGVQEKESVGFVTAGMLGLLAFLLGVALSMAQARYDQRRDVVRDEANAIGTAWLRAGLVDEASASQLRTMLRAYTKIRMQAIEEPVRSTEFAADVTTTNTMQTELWGVAARAVQAQPGPVTAMLLPALNDMFDLSLSSRRAFTDRVPVGVLRMLLWATIISVGVIGFHFGLGGSRQPVVSLLLLVFWTSGLVLIVDMNDPLHGTVRVDPGPLVWTLQGFGPAPPAR